MDKELWQVSVTFGNFESHRAAEEFAKYMQSTEEMTISSSITIRSSRK